MKNKENNSSADCECCDHMQEACLDNLTQRRNDTNKASPATVGRSLTHCLGTLQPDCSFPKDNSESRMIRVVTCIVPLPNHDCGQEFCARLLECPSPVENLWAVLLVSRSHATDDFAFLFDMRTDGRRRGFVAKQKLSHATKVEPLQNCSGTCGT